MQIKADTITNPAFRELVSLGVIDPTGVRLLSPRTRDGEIPVLIDESSGVIFLQRAETTVQYYETDKTEDLDHGQFITTFANGGTMRTTPLEDDKRRFEQVKNRTSGRKICDFGCGYGGFLRLNEGHAFSVAGVELRNHCRAHLQETCPDARVEKSILDFDTSFDLVTLFHVLEHIPTPTAVLADIRQRIAPGGEVLIEVPHAGDFLISRVDVPAFRNFTFWSEHLVLHTPASLTAVLNASGFTDIRVQGYQRYGFTNHLGWLIDGQPGGQVTLKDFERPNMEESYGKYLVDLGATDTLIAFARVNSPQSDIKE